MGVLCQDLVKYDYTDLENFDFHREDMLTDIIEYEYGAPDRKTSLIVKHFLPYASVYPNIFKIVQQADSSPAAFAIAEDVKQVVCPQASWDTGMALLDRALKDFIPELSMDLHKVKSASDIKGGPGYYQCHDLHVTQETCTWQGQVVAIREGRLRLRFANSRKQHQFCSLP